MAKKKKKRLFDEFKEGYTYPFLDIDDYVKEGHHTLSQYGITIIGEHFLVVRYIDENRVTSFVLDGATGTQYIYKCIYTDIKF